MKQPTALQEFSALIRSIHFVMLIFSMMWVTLGEAILWLAYVGEHEREAWVLWVAPIWCPFCGFAYYHSRKAYDRGDYWLTIKISASIWIPLVAMYVWKYLGQIINVGVRA